MNAQAPAQLAITTSALSPSTATVGTAYFSQAITATGGTTPYTWSVSSQPNGLTMNPTTGVLSGTPTVFGTFSPTVVVHDNGSPQQSTSKPLSLTANQPATGPTAHFTMSGQGLTQSDPNTLTLSAASGSIVPVTFTSTSTAGSTSIINYVWKSNGTQICTTPSCTYSFNTPRTSTIDLTVTDTNGKSSPAQGTVVVNAAAPVSGPTASFTMSSSGVTPASSPGTLTVTAPSAGSSVNVIFTSTSTAGSTPITSYLWKSNGTQICPGSTTSCTTAFSAANTSITLTLTDQSSKTAIATGTVDVAQPAAGPTAHFTMSSQGLTQTDPNTLTLSVASGSSAQVTFASTSIQGSTPIASYVWKSNGTQICTSASCTVPLSTSSNTIALTVIDGNNKADTAQGAVVINSQIGPTAHFTISGQGLTQSDPNTLTLSVASGGTAPVTFTSTSTVGSAPITTYSWKINGTQICTTPSCTYSFPTPSTSTIILTVTDSNNQIKTAQGSVVVNTTTPVIGPTASFTMSSSGVTPVGSPGTLTVTAASVGSSVNVIFTSTSVAGSAPITSYIWKSNGGQICPGSTTICATAFSAASSLITLTVTDQSSKTATATGTVDVKLPVTGPTAHFTMSSQGLTQTDPSTLTLSTGYGGSAPVTFTSTSTTGSASITSYLWKSNGTQICSAASCTYSFGTPSNIVVLTVIDRNNKSSMATGTVAVSIVAPHITSVTPRIPGSKTVLEPITITGTNLSTASANGYLVFTDTITQKWYSTTYPKRIQSSSLTQWVYTINDNGDIGQWTVQMVNGDGQKSNIVPFNVY